jgi:hypothetical protein
MSILATSCKPVLLVSYLDTYLSDLEQWLREWRIAINVSNSNANIFAKVRNAFPQSPNSTAVQGANPMG